MSESTRVISRMSDEDVLYSSTGECNRTRFQDTQYLGAGCFCHVRVEMKTVDPDRVNEIRVRYYTSSRPTFAPGHEEPFTIYDIKECGRRVVISVISSYGCEDISIEKPDADKCYVTFVWSKLNESDIYFAEDPARTLNFSF